MSNMKTDSDPTPSVPFLSKYLLVINRDRFCIASSNPSYIGKKLDLPLNPAGKNINEITIRNHPHTVIPLRYRHRYLASLIVDGHFAKFDKVVLLIKNLAELTVQEYFNQTLPSLDSTDKFFIRLINNFQIEELASFKSEARALGYDFNHSYVAIMLKLVGFWEECMLANNSPCYEREEVIRKWKKRIEASFKGFFAKSNEVITAYLGQDTFIIFQAVNAMEEEKLRYRLIKSFPSIFGPIKTEPIESLMVGFSSSHRSLLGLRESCEEANLALKLGPKLLGKRDIYHFDDLGLLRILAHGGNQDKIVFAREILKELPGNNNLVITLETFFEENLNLNQTAKKLGIHRNTAIYRLNQIQDILDLDPRNFDQAIILKIALMIRRYL